MKKKVAFIVNSYGKDINGGVEQHARMLAERLVDNYDVEVLTTCVRNFYDGENCLPEGEEWDNKVLIRRFKTEPEFPELFEEYTKKAKKIRRVRKHLYQLGLLRTIASAFPIWTGMSRKEDQLMKSYAYYSPQLFRYITENKDRYTAFIPINISYPLAYYTSLYVPEKTILIPTMHYESSSFRAIYTKVFTNVAYVAFNTLSEQRLAKGIFGNKMAPHGIVSVGVEEPAKVTWDITKKKYSLPDRYLLYVGRIERSKLNKIPSFYQKYIEKHPESNLKLILVGGGITPPIKPPNIHYTGFVSDEEKVAIIQHATVIVNPSKFESLSLILLEAMKQGKPMLVNGKCDVLKEHCINSDYAAWYYTGKKSFVKKLHQLVESEDLRKQMGEKGKRYVEENYNWPLIMGRLKAIIEKIN